VRAQIDHNLTMTFALFNLWQQSETIIDPDVGMDSAGPPSRRYGYEINITYKINRWLEFYGSYSGDHTRFTRDFDDGTGHLGKYITDAPFATGAFALYLTNLGRGAAAWNIGISAITPCRRVRASTRRPPRIFPRLRTAPSRRRLSGK